MDDRLTLEQRRVVASLMEVYGSPTVVRQKFAERFARRDTPSRLTIYRVYAKSVKTGSVADNYRGNAGRSRTGRSDCCAASHTAGYIDIDHRVQFRNRDSAKNNLRVNMILTNAVHKYKYKYIYNLRLYFYNFL